jgi:hypothetical protein
MKKLILSILLLLGAFQSKADQYQIVPEDYAIAAVDILNSQSDVFLWCDCCDGEYIRFIQVQYASYEYAYGEGNDCYVFLSGYDEYGDWFEESIDLAYTYIADGEWATRLSNYIGLDAEPCYDEPLSYYDYYPFGGDGYEGDSPEEVYYEDEYVAEDNYYFEGYEDVITLYYFTCGEYCYLGFADSEGIEDEVVIDYNIFPGELWGEGEDGETILNPYYYESKAYVRIDPFEMEYEDGSTGQTRIISEFQLLNE